MLSINTNLGAFIVQSSLNVSTNGLNQAIERMSTGFKINHAKDNAANYSINTKLSSKISAYQVAEDNVSQGINMLAVASGSLDQMNNMLARIRSLAVQVSNGTYGEASINAVNKEVNALIDEINRSYDLAEYNNVKLFRETPPAVATGVLIDAIIPRKTSSMISLSSVDKSAILAAGVYSISTAEELAKLAEMTNNGFIAEGSEFVLANDIDLSSYSSGEGWGPIGTLTNMFNGKFDGNGYVISNLYINRLNSEAQGLFGVVNKAEISNLGVVNVDITGNANVGAIIGRVGIAASKAHTTLYNCYSTGKVSGNDVGGLIGRIWEWCSYKLTNSYSECTVNSSDVGGGVLGNLRYANGTIEGCYATGDVTATECAGGLLGDTGAGYSNYIKNSYATGNILASGSRNSSSYAGGLCARVNSGSIENSYATGNVTNYSTYRYACVGGLVADIGTADIKNCYTSGKVFGYSSTMSRGGLVGCRAYGTIENCYVLGEGSAIDGVFVGRFTTGSGQWYLKNCYYNPYYDIKGIPMYGPDVKWPPKEMTVQAYSENKPFEYKGAQKDNTDVNIIKDCILQVGIMSDKSNQIVINTSFSLEGLEVLRSLGLDNLDYLSMIDNLLSRVSAKQIEIGAVGNRLESALEQIGVAYDNLASTQSTLRDADIAEESSAYIRNQILQQAAMTLMATANQTPAIALQLL